MGGRRCRRQIRIRQVVERALEPRSDPGDLLLNLQIEIERSPSVILNHQHRARSLALMTFS